MTHDSCFTLWSFNCNLLIDSGFQKYGRAHVVISLIEPCWFLMLSCQRNQMWYYQLVPVNPFARGLFKSSVLSVPQLSQSFVAPFRLVWNTIAQTSKWTNIHKIKEMDGIHVVVKDWQNIPFNLFNPTIFWIVDVHTEIWENMIRVTIIPQMEEKMEGCANMHMTNERMKKFIAEFSLRLCD